MGLRDSYCFMSSMRYRSVFWNVRETSWNILKYSFGIRIFPRTFFIYFLFKFYTLILFLVFFSWQRNFSHFIKLFCVCFMQFSNFTKLNFSFIHLIRLDFFIQRKFYPVRFLNSFCFLPFYLNNLHINVSPCSV